MVNHSHLEVVCIPLIGFGTQGFSHENRVGQPTLNFSHYFRSCESRPVDKVFCLLSDRPHSSHSLMFISNVDGDGLLSISKGRVYRLWVQSLPFLLLFHLISSDIIISR